MHAQLPGKLRLQAGIVASLVLHGQVVCRQALACLGKPRPLRGGPVGEDHNKVCFCLCNRRQGIVVPYANAGVQAIVLCQREVPASTVAIWCIVAAAVCHASHWVRAVTVLPCESGRVVCIKRVANLVEERIQKAHPVCTDPDVAILPGASLKRDAIPRAQRRWHHNDAPCELVDACVASSHKPVLQGTPLLSSVQLSKPASLVSIIVQTGER
mmetsp:Transcript_37633/g.111271  ORF Transcript_37633/g.111271 Transcript_37633/m.111271 type:complete len:213 (-) Transcript_37633:710-1348(-)